jgi:uncharacterized repeat protein (TIGR03847 family)
MSRDFGSAEVLGAEAVGQPGQRRFRIYVQAERNSAIMWIEKEQLNSLSLALDRFLAQITEGQVLRTEAQAGGRPVTAGMPGDFPVQPTYEFQVGQIKINYDERSTQFLLSAVPLQIVMERDEAQVFMDEEQAVSFLFTHRQAQYLSSTIAQVVTAGRPVCPLCRTPLDGGPHACIKQNGHREIVQIAEEDEDE